jgi:brefeldin A-resistance guanine nucleotide exchange factor 1
VYESFCADGQKSIADAMRELLEAFRLPGEAQPIARITETFAEHFFSFRPSGSAQSGMYCRR